MKKEDTIFLIAGRTGGPIVPLIATAKNLEYTPIILGIKKGVETNLAKNNGYKIEYLPEAKFTLGTFKKASFSERFQGVAELSKMGFRFVFSFFKSIFLLLKYKPKAVFSAGSFLAVPVISATRFLRLFGLKTKIITHQQDPLPGLANKFTFPLSDLKTCVFTYSKKFKQFKYAKIIPNPINIDLFKRENLTKVLNKLKEKDLDLYNFISHKSKPILLVMGGGSGSQFLNGVVEKNIQKLNKDFKVLHLSGALQTETQDLKEGENYLKREFLNYEYPAVLEAADVVLARPGLGTITELMYLKKPAILVPIAYSHQEKNAEEVKNIFTVLSQNKEVVDWVGEVKKTFENGYKGDAQDIEQDLREYYGKINEMIKN